MAESLTFGTSESKTSTSCAEYVEYCKVGAEDWLVQNVELSKVSCSVNYQNHHTAVVMPHQPTKVARTTSIMKHFLIEPTNVINCLGLVHQPQRNHGQTGNGIKQVNHGKVIGNIVAGDIHKTNGPHRSTTLGDGYLNTQGSFTRDRWTQLTLLMNIMTHTTFTESNLSVSSAVVNPSLCQHD